MTKIDRFRWEMAIYRDAVEAGADPRALLHAIARCGDYGFPLPIWIRDAVHRQLHRDASRKNDRGKDARELAKYFADHPGGSLYEASMALLRKRASTRKKRGRVNWDIYETVRSLNRGGTAIDAGLFEQVGAKLDYSGSMVREHYYATKAFCARYGIDRPHEFKHSERARNVVRAMFLRLYPSDHPLKKV
jgi:hypothetical protein